MTRPQEQGQEEKERRERKAKAPTRRSSPSPVSLLSLLSSLSLALSGCARPADGRLALDFGRADAERIARFYFGGYAAPDGADPFAVGLLDGEGDALSIHPDSLDARFRPLLRDANADGTLDKDELAAFFDATFAEARTLPPTLDALRTLTPGAPWSPDSPAWFAVEIEGSAMTAARRRVLVPVTALRAALGGYRAANNELHYPDGTTILGEHLDEGGQVVETTVKRRRADGFWDFAVYDRAGQLAPATTTAPRPLRSPAQCLGCHLGRRLFDPEKSYPAAAPDGPFGPRAIRADGVDPAAPATTVATAQYEEHARRADGVLGLYGTLYTARLLADRAAGRPLAPEDAALLAGLEL